MVSKNSHHFKIIFSIPKSSKRRKKKNLSILPLIRYEDNRSSFKVATQATRMHRNPRKVAIKHDLEAISHPEGRQTSYRRLSSSACMLAIFSNSRRVNWTSTPKVGGEKALTRRFFLARFNLGARPLRDKTRCKFNDTPLRETSPWGALMTVLKSSGSANRFALSAPRRDEIV